MFTDRGFSDQKMNFLFKRWLTNVNEESSLTNVNEESSLTDVNEGSVSKTIIFKKLPFLKSEKLSFLKRLFLKNEKLSFLKTMLII